MEGETLFSSNKDTSWDSSGQFIFPVEVHHRNFGFKAY